MNHCEKAAVTVNPTNRCNLRCGYCMANSSAEQERPIVIPIEFAERGIRDALTGYPAGVKAKKLRFFSPGEPTQEMDIIRRCVRFARALLPGCPVELQTNGLFESTEDTMWIRDNINVVWFSLDGPRAINDRNRPDTQGQGRTDEIEQNMAMVGEKAAIGVRSTITEDTMRHQDEVVEYYHNLGVRHLAFNPVIRPIRRGDEGVAEVTQHSVMDFARNFISAYRTARALGIRITNSLAFNFDGATDVACRSCLPVPQLNPDGSVSSCDMALYRDTKEQLKCFLYGRWIPDEGRIEYDLAKIEYLRGRRLPNLPKCRNCDIGVYCAGGCAGRIAFQTGDIYGVLPEYCVATKFLAKAMDLGKKDLALGHP